MCGGLFNTSELKTMVDSKNVGVAICRETVALIRSTGTVFNPAKVRLGIKKRTYIFSTQTG